MRDELGRWVEELGLHANNVEIEDPGWEWGVIVTPTPTAEPPRVLVARRSDVGHLTLQHTTSVSENHLTLLADLSEQVRETFLADLHLKLFSRPLEISFAGDPLGEGGEAASMRITLQTRLIDERVTCERFYTSYKAVRNAGTVVNLMFNRLVAHTPRSRVPDQWQILELRTDTARDIVSGVWRVASSVEDAIPSVERVAPSADDVAGKVKDIVRGLDMGAEFSPLRTHTVPEDGRSVTFTVMKIILPETSYGREAIARVYESLGEGLTEVEGKALSTWVIPGE